jgi:hypothetical protein
MPFANLVRTREGKDEAKKKRSTKTNEQGKRIGQGRGRNEDGGANEDVGLNIAFMIQLMDTHTGVG